MSDSDSTFGTQSLDRAIEIIRSVGSAPDGMSLTGVYEAVGLPKPTVHRLLRALVRNDFLSQDVETKRYRLGAELVVLGRLAGARSTDLYDLCHDRLVALAADTGDTAHVVVRSGYHSLCIDRQLGAYPVKVVTIDVGDRRPLGIGASGLALLMELEPDEVREILDVVRPHLEGYSGVSVRSIKEEVAAARARGYAVSSGYNDIDLVGIGVPLTSASGVAGALSVVGVPDRMADPHREDAIEAMLSMKLAVESQLTTAR